MGWRFSARFIITGLALRGLIYLFFYSIFFILDFPLFVSSTAFSSSFEFNFFFPTSFCSLFGLHIVCFSTAFGSSFRIPIVCFFLQHFLYLGFTLYVFFFYGVLFICNSHCSFFR